MVRRAPGASEARVYDVSSRSVSLLHANLNVGSKAAEAGRRARRKAELQDTATDVIQDFAFPTVCTSVKLSPDGRYIFAAGTYPPQLHVYDTAELSLKFKRHVDNEIVAFQVLESDWRKFALLTADRFVDLHSPFGSHFRTRVPTFGRDLMLSRSTCDLFVCGDGPDVWRLNLDEGRFLAPVPTVSGAGGGNNVCGLSPANGLLAFGGASGQLDIWDPRVVGEAQTPAATLDIHPSIPHFSSSSSSSSSSAAGITAVRFDDRDGVTLAVGATTGHTLLFDLRAPRATLARDQGNGLPVRSVRLHDDRRHCLSADARSIKVWARATGRTLATVEPDAAVNHVAVVGGTGVMIAGLEAPRVKTYYVPSLGAAPAWCAFLDSFTEELERGRGVEASGSAAGVFGNDEDDEDEDAEGGNAGQKQEATVYENYKFVTEEELEALGMRGLIGTDVLKPYMHGFFVHQKLHRKAVEASEPFAFEKYRKQKARERLEAERESRISKVKRGGAKNKKAKVNQSVVDALKERQKKAKGAGSAKKAETGLSILQDDRFSAMFSNEDFKVDEDAERFQYLNPAAATGGAKAKRGRKEEEEESDEEYLERLDLDDDDDKDDANDADNVERVWSSGDEDSDDDSDADDDDDNEAGAIRKYSGSGSRSGAGEKGKRIPRMYEADGGLGQRAGQRGQSQRTRGSSIHNTVALGDRVAVARRRRKD